MCAIFTKVVLMFRLIKLFSCDDELPTLDCEELFVGAGEMSESAVEDIDREEAMWVLVAVVESNNP